jgi:hypothetical protein
MAEKRYLRPPNDVPKTAENIVVWRKSHLHEEQLTIGGHLRETKAQFSGLFLSYINHKGQNNL